jgi:hypothetical protein
MTVSPGFLHSIDVLPLARRNLTVARAFFLAVSTADPTEEFKYFYRSITDDRVF